MPEKSLLEELVDRINELGQTMRNDYEGGQYNSYSNAAFLLEARIAAIEKLKDGWSGAELNLLNEVLVILRGKP